MERVLHADLRNARAAMHSINDFLCSEVNRVMINLQESEWS